ncbi:MAG TPA: FtsK/SpoIIIE domain-containing protein [Pseudolysinimonas sp.]|jgi:hypothetical protein
MTSSLESAAARLSSAQSALIGSLDSARRAAANGRTAEVEKAQRALARQHALVRNQAAQAVSEHSLRARDLAETITRRPDDSLAVAEYVDAGRLSLDGAASGVNSEISAPFLLPLVGRGNVLLEVAAERQDELVQSLVWAALAATAPGQLDLVAYDPKLSGVLAPFSILRSVSDDAVQVSNRSADLEHLIDRISSDVQRVNDTLRGTSDSLIDFRASVGQPVERFQLVILLDYPEGVEESTHRKLLSLVRAGATAGVSFVIVIGQDSARDPGWMARADLEAVSTTIRDENGTLRWTAHPEFRLSVQPEDPAALAGSVDALAKRAASASAPVVPFDRVQPTQTRWSDSSADGLRFSVGVDGPDVREISLGDERDQRHNILITGAVGQGKSNLLKVIIYSLAQRYSPEELEFYLLDFKEGVTLYPMAPTATSPDYLPHARVLGLESDREFGLAVLRHIESEFARRAKLFRPYGDNIARYRAAVPDAVMPRIVVIIDEFQMLFDPNDRTAEEAAQLVETIARKGRSYGVHLILASQTISGIAALMAREGGIFAQFPIRLALKNSAQESFAALGQGNDAAARLRARGEAILNADYGHVDSNSRIIVAGARDEQLDQLRHEWWLAARDRGTAPMVFDGSRPVRVSDSLDAIHRARAARGTPQAPAVALLGYPISVADQPIGVRLSAEPGRHLAVLGAGEHGSDSGPTNVAIGTLQVAALSLALQHPEGGAEFVSLDMLDEETLTTNNHALWLSMMESLGYPVRRVDRNEVAEYLSEVVADLANREVESPPRYIVGFGVDRASALDIPDMFAHRPSEDLQQLLRAGSTGHVHLLGWWANAATFRSHIGFGGEGFIDAMLMLRLDQGTVQELLSPFVTWSVRDNRGLLSDRTGLAAPTTIIPFSPLTMPDVSAVSKTDWNQ